MNRLVIAAAVIAAVASTCHGDGRSDAEIRAAVVWNLAPRCGGGSDKDRLYRRPSLADSVGIGGDTNRLARILADIAQTNDAWYAKMAMWQLEKYGTAEQLPFLYSCATNPAVGDKAVKAVLRIEGVTSNSLQVIQTYLTITNEFSRSKQHDRSLVCEELLRKVFESQECLQFRPLCVAMALDFAQNVNTMHVSIDDALVAVDPTYRYSKRRLAVMRTAQGRCVNPGLYNYVTNAINELVAYPEANLPD